MMIARFKPAFSLIELIIAMLISSIIIMTVVSIFTLYRHQSLRIDALMLQQEHFRFVSHILNQSVAMAGYIGCASLFDHLKIINHDDNPDAAIGPSDAISILDANTTRNLPRFLHSHLSLSDHILFIRYGSRQRTSLLNWFPNRHQLDVSDELRFKSGDDILISDCGHAELLHVKHVAYIGKQQQLTINHNLVFNYKAAHISLVMNTAFYLADNKQVVHHQHVYALYEQRYNRPRRELIPFMQSLTVSRNRRQLIIHFQLHHQSFTIHSLLREYPS